MTAPFALWPAPRARFEAPEWAYFEEVRNGTGYARSARTADALAMSLWPSRGLELHGIEVKASRHDWLREKEDPSKAEEIQRFCDRWWLAITDAEIVQPGELPPTWGLLVPKGKKLVVKVEAPKLEALPMTRLFMASLLRRASESNVPRAEFDAAVEEKLKGAREQWERSRQHEVRHTVERLERLEKSIADFEKASGVRLNEWGSSHIGEAVKLVLSCGAARVQEDLARLATQAENIASVIREQIKRVDAKSEAA